MAGPLDNSIGWAQFKLLGGAKNLVATSIGYMLMGVVVIIAMVKGIREPSQVTFSGFITFFLIIQVVSLLLYGTLRVNNAVRADVNGKLLESHRLMPTSPFVAVLGYLFGSTAQAFSLFFITFVLGAVCVSGAGMRLQPWVISNLVLLSFAIFVWTIVLFFSFRTGGAGMGFVIGMAFMATSSGAALVMLPAANILISPMIGTTIFDMRTGMALEPALLIAGVAQFAIGLIYLTAASRRYSRDDTLSFDSILGLLLLAVWTGLCVVGLRDQTLFYSRFRGAPSYQYYELAATTSACTVLLLAILPVSSAVRADVLPARLREANRGFHVPPWLAVIAAIAVASMSVLSHTPYHGPAGAEIRTVLVAATFLIGSRFMLGVAHNFKWGPRKFMIAWLLLTWLVPLAAETIRSATVPVSIEEPDRMSQIGMISPPGELYQAWTRNPYVHSEGFAGLATQCAFAAGTVVLFYTTRRKPAQSL